jgi:hypothetical protein
MSFKLKQEPKRQEEFRQTVDAVHTKKMAEFAAKRETVTEKRERIATIKAELATLKDPYAIMIKEDEIYEIQDEINQITSDKDKIDYFMDAGEYLFQYHENQDRISRGDTTSSAATAAAAAAKKPARSGRSVLSFFKIIAPKIEEVSTISTGPTTATSIPKKPRLTNDQIVDSYMSHIDPYYATQQRPDIDIMTQCDDCGSDLIIYQNEAKMVCTNPLCAMEEYMLIECEKPSYKDPPREQSSFPYKRINHFNEWLAQFQAKESTDIPQDVYDQIIVELRKERIIDMSSLKQTKLREILKKLKLAKYYEHVPHIICRLNGVSAPVLCAETENRLRHMFREIQPAFIRNCPPERKNFLSYAYVLYKFCELLEMDEFLSCFPLLKSREKLHEQDKIWRKICEEMAWEFIRSV